MTTTEDLEHWDLHKLEMVMGATQDANQSLKKLGDTLDGSRDSLWNWGGDAAATWRAQHGKIRTDIDAQGHQTQKLHDELSTIYPQVKSVKDDYNSFKQSAAASGLTVTAPGVVSSDDPDRQSDVEAAQTKLNGILQRANTVDEELAQAIRGATTPQAPAPQTPTPTPTPAPKPDDGKTTPADQLPLPTKGGHTPFPTEATKDNGPDVSHHLADNPRPAPLLAGLSADQWRQRLANYKPGDPLPDPRTPTGDKAIDTLANAAGQQNTTYAWGGNKSKDGPSQGQGDNGDGANQNHDWDRYGYDCGGLVRYSVQQGAGFDVGQGTNSIDSNSHFTHPNGGGGLPSQVAAAQAQPGDVLVFGGSGAYQGNGTDHTGIYIGNGYMINAPESGEPVRVDTVGPGRGKTDILRVPTS